MNFDLILLGRTQGGVGRAPPPPPPWVPGEFLALIFWAGRSVGRSVAVVRVVVAAAADAADAAAVVVVVVARGGGANSVAGRP